MIIAVGTCDGVSVCEHLARSSSFEVFEVENGRVLSRSVRERGRDACGNHTSFTSALEGCQVVLCGGIGQGAVDSLSGAGIEPVVLSERHDIGQAIAQYLEGTLRTTEARVCLCGPGH